MTTAAIATDYRLTDDEVASFIISGYHVVQPNLRAGLNQEIYDALEALPSNPGDAVIDEVPQLNEVWNSPKVVGSLTSLIGPDYEMFPHRHCHRNAPGTPSQQIHQDNLNDLRIDGGQVRLPDRVDLVLAMYYPQDVERNMGPTCILPGTHVLKALPERMASQGNFRDQYIASVPAGSVVILHYDIWHAGTANTSERVRYMLKFLFQRTTNPSVPSWNHDPANDIAIRKRLEAENPMSMQRGLAAKQRHFRTRMWNRLAGDQSLDLSYHDKWAGAWR
jgi:hypothetical protein